jgi:hypothetical protein
VFGTAGSGAYNVTSSDYVVLCDATGTGGTGKSIVLPNPTGIGGRVYIVKQVNAQSAGAADQCKVSTVMLTPSTSGTLALSAPNSTSTNSMSSITVVSDGVRWWLLGTGP